MSGVKEWRTGMGDLTSIINNVTGALGVSLDIANDPYLPETVCHLGQLHQINAGGDPGPCNATQAGLPGGIGLGRAQPYLRTYVWAQKNKWAYVAAAAVVLGVPFLIGYDVGKGKKGGGS